MPSDYEVELFRAKGFQRRQCPTCSAWFWSLGEEATCGETPCVEYSFIGASPFKKRLTLKAMREEFLSFLEARGHTRVRRYPIVARWREDVFFTQASIYPFQPWVIGGQAEPPANPLAISQPCARFVDIDNVGKTGRHLTLFEMMAHHVFNRPGKEIYWSDRTTELCHEFFTDRLGAASEAITYKEAWWEGGGNSGPCFEVLLGGAEAATLVFMKYRETAGGRQPMETQVVDTGYGLERLTWLSQGSPSAYEAVFGDTMTYIKRAAGLQKTDDRMLEEYSRVAGMVSVESLADLRSIRERAAKRLSTTVDELSRAVEPFEHMYAVVDHARALMFLLADGVVPSNVKEGYFARLLVRRAMRALRSLKLDMKLSDPVGFMIDQYKEDFPEILENRSSIVRLLDLETKRYEETLQKGRETVRRAEQDLAAAGTNALDTETLIQLYDSHGLNPEVVVEFASLPVEVPDDFFARVAARHERPVAEKAASEVPIDLPPTVLRVYDPRHKQTFRAKVLAVHGDGVILNHTYFYPEGGGQEADHGYIGGYAVHDVQRVGSTVLHYAKEAAKLKPGRGVKCEIDWERRQQLTRHHTATHIVLGAARKTLGNHVWQTGAHKGADMARLDITHFEGLTDEQLRTLEDAANGIVLRADKVGVETLPRSRAEDQCGFRLYQGGSVPGGELRVVTIPDWDCEACGGTHCHNTAEVGLIKILRSKRIQDGVVRLEFVAGKAALRHVQKLAAETDAMAVKLSTSAENLVPAVDRLVEELTELRKSSGQAKRADSMDAFDLALAKAERVGGVTVLSGTFPVGPQDLAAMTREWANRSPSPFVLILNGRGKTAASAISVSGVAMSAKAILEAGIGILGGKGGGRDDFAQGAGPLVDKLPEAMEAYKGAVRRNLPSAESDATGRTG